MADPARSAPTIVTDPAGIGGSAYATRDAAEINALWNGVINQAGTIGGTANAITAVCIPPLIANPAHGQTFRLTPASNNSSTVTVNLDGRGAIALKNEDGGALAANELVAGRPILFWYDGDNSYFRLCGATQQALLGSIATQVAAASMWEQFGDTIIGAPVAQVEHTFVAGAYSRIMVILSAVSPGTPGVAPIVTLRHSSAAIVTLTHLTGDSGEQFMDTATFVIDLISATKTHYGFWDIDVSIASGTATGSSATAPDRIRFAWSSTNIDGGRVMSYGLKV